MVSGSMAGQIWPYNETGSNHKKVLFSTPIAVGDKLRHGMIFMKPSTLIMEKMTLGTVVQNPLACLVGSIWPYTVESFNFVVVNFADFCLLICVDVFVWMYQCTVSVRTLTQFKLVFIENVNFVVELNICLLPLFI